MFFRALLTVILLSMVGIAAAGPIIQAISTLTAATPTVIDGTSKEYPLSVTMIP